MKEEREFNGEMLREGECFRKDTCVYVFQWNEGGKRRSKTARTLGRLREIEVPILERLDRLEGIFPNQMTLDEMFAIWKAEKRGVRENTMGGYVGVYTVHAYNKFGKHELLSLRRAHIRRWYLDLLDSGDITMCGLKNLHQVVHQICKLATEYGYILQNPASCLLGEIMRIVNYEPDRRIALTKSQQDIFVTLLEDDDLRWRAVFMLMLTTGLRVSELCGLQWSNIDFEKETLTVERALVYYKHEDGICRGTMAKPKTRAGSRTIPLMKKMINILQEYKSEMLRQKIRCVVSVDGYKDFVFVNRVGRPFGEQPLNKHLKVLIRDYNEVAIFNSEESGEEPLLLPNFSCHCLRHTFATRYYEKEKNIKSLQYLLGHNDIQTTLDRYAHGSLEMVKVTFDDFEADF